MPQQVAINAPPTMFVDGSGKLTREAYRFLLGLTRNSNQAVSGEVLTDADSGLEGGGFVSDGVSLSIADGGVTNARLRPSLATSVIGRYQGSSGEVADIQAVNDDQALARIDGELVFVDIDELPVKVPDGDYGDILVSGTGTVWTIDNGVVSNAKLANVATATFKGRTTAGTGSPEDLTATQATALLNVFTSALKGLAPASGGGTTNFLRADGTWASTAPAGAALTRTDDTNVTLTLGGSPGTALLAATSLTLGWTGQLSVARGGTGVSTSTGTGSVVLSTSPTLVTPTLGVASATSINFGGGALSEYVPPTAPAFNAADFTGSGSMTWTVASGDVVSLMYAIIGKTMTVWFNIQTTSVGGTPARFLQIAIPASKTAQAQTYSVYNYFEGVSWARGFVSVDASGSVVRLERQDNSNWTATTDSTYVLGQISFPIN